MFKIAVCIKQVPAFTTNAIDMQTGLLKREKLKSHINIADLSALETALRIKEKLEENNLCVEVHSFSMGPKSAEQILKDSFSIGVDKAFLISDKAFAGSDVISTGYTLYQAIKSQGQYSIIICGNQTTDGSTGFVSSVLAEKFDYPLLSYVYQVENIENNSITILQEMENYSLKLKANYPCVISVLPEICIPRLPTLRYKMQAKKKEVSLITFNDLEDENLSHFGMKGAKTKVINSYTPVSAQKNDIIFCDGKSASECILRESNEKIL